MRSNFNNFRVRALALDHRPAMPQRTLGFDWISADAADTLTKLEIAGQSAPRQKCRVETRRGRSRGRIKRSPGSGSSSDEAAIAPRVGQRTPVYQRGTLGAHWQHAFHAMELRRDAEEAREEDERLAAQRNAPPKKGSCANLAVGMRVNLFGSSAPHGAAGIVCQFKGRGWVVVALDGDENKTAVVRGRHVEAEARAPQSSADAVPRRAPMQAEVDQVEGGASGAGVDRPQQRMGKQRRAVRRGAVARRTRAFSRGDRVEFVKGNKTGVESGVRGVVTTVRGRGWLSVRRDDSGAVVRTRTPAIARLLPESASESSVREAAAVAPRAQSPQVAVGCAHTTGTPPTSPALEWTHRAQSVAASQIDGDDGAPGARSLRGRRGGTRATITSARGVKRATPGAHDENKCTRRSVRRRRPSPASPSD